MKICLSLAPYSTKEAKELIKNVKKGVDVIELRIDRIPNPDLETILQKPRPKVIITNRRKSEGGNFSGSEKDQFEILTRAIKLGAEYIDVEFSWGKDLLKKIIEQKNKTKVILSYHNYYETPKNLTKLLNEMMNFGADIIKIASMAKNINDNMTMFNLLKDKRPLKPKLIALCMGEHGQISRILGAKYNSFLTYAALNETSKTESGQLTLTDLTKTYKIHKLNKKTKIFGLVGNPVTFSKGIYYHNRIFSQKKVNAVYVNLLVDELNSFIQTFRKEITGLSITMPFKKAIVPMLDSIDDEAEKINLVNTVIRQGTKLIGFNTDLPAVKSILQRIAPIKNKKFIIFGTGATAKTIAFAAKIMGAIVIIVGRSVEKAKILAEELNCQWANISNLQAIKSDVLVNATPLGMNNELEFRYLPDQYFNKQMTVFDVVYNPPITPLLEKARRRGCTIITGYEFFKRQAQLQSRLFLQSIL